MCIITSSPFRMIDKKNVHYAKYKLLNKDMSKYKATKYTHFFSEQDLTQESESFIKLDPVGAINPLSQSTPVHPASITVKHTRQITFDSLFEDQTFQVISGIYPVRTILVHHSFNLNTSFIVKRLNNDSENTKFTDLLKLKPDFVISNSLNPSIDDAQIIIESKGVMTRDYLLKLYIFLQFFPSLADKYVIVFQRKSFLASQSLKRLIRQFGITALTLSELPVYLQSLKH